MSDAAKELSTSFAGMLTNLQYFKSRHGRVRHEVLARESRVDLLRQASKFYQRYPRRRVAPVR